MSKPKQSELLSQKIVALQQKRKAELSDLKIHYQTLTENLKPSNLIKAGISEVYNTSFDKKMIFNTLSSIAIGFISKKIVSGKSKNPIAKAIGNIVQFAMPFITNKIQKTNHEE